jgi:hypothetical protein
MPNYYDAQGNLQSGGGIPAVASLTAVSATGPGTALDGGITRTNPVMAVTTSAGVSAGVVQLQGSFDGTTWFNMPATSAITTNVASITTVTAVAWGVARFLRANITTIITGGTITALVAWGA